MAFDPGPVLAAALALPRQRPVTFVFASAPYLDLLSNWIGHAERAGVTNLLVVALDEATHRAATAHGVGSVLLPGIASRGELWLVRARLFSALAAGGIDFIHSDADAIWIASPLAAAFADGADLAFSSGTVWPKSIVEKWGFVLCCGFFAARGTPATAAFFAEVAERVRVCEDDQIAVNEALLDAGIRWDDRAPSEERMWLDTPFRVFSRTVLGEAPGLTVALLPHSRFPRLPEVSAETLVIHPVVRRVPGNSGPERLPALLDRLGLWRPRATAAAA
jgi:hypothetical protein